MRFIVHSLSAILNLSIFMMVALLIIPPTADPPPASEEEMVVIGPGHPGDPCTVEVHRSVLPKLEEMGIREWSQSCLAARASASQQPTLEKGSPR